MIKPSTRTLAGMAFMTALTCFGSLLRIPFYPVPVSLQSLFPLLAGTLFTPGAAAVTQGIYLLLGLMGLPLFNQGGGPSYLLQPTFGYLAAMPLAAALVATGRARLKRVHFSALLLLMAATTLFLLVFGTLWLYFSFRWFTGKALPFSGALMAGMVPFLPVEALKVAAAALIGCKLETRIERQRREGHG
ncbi:MAG TPA: biotin transporter BioY [bacterium]|nr:biotin transporter BioY [bacterium]HQG46147.1 biotin transporter BioY [bacterium]HQI47551.1 biotin transporter BioY [bacterium]HQJ63327.1 biotin transporter BioY [bacterium]